MYEPETDDLVAKHASGDYAAQVSGLRIGIGERLSGWVAANRQTILNSDPILDLGDIARSLNPRPRSALCTPLLVEGKLVGVLSLYSTSREVFTSDHGRVVEMVGRQVSQPLRDASRFDVVRQTSSKDQITGLPNIDQLRSLFGASVHAESYDGSGLSLVVVDVVVLDQSGREVGGGAGADILPLVAESIGKSLRGADIVFRSEGDEFVLLLEQTDHQTSQRIAKRILEAGLENHDGPTRHHNLCKGGSRDRPTGRSNPGRRSRGCEKQACGAGGSRTPTRRSSRRPVCSLTRKKPAPVAGARLIGH